jgi:hypothetical protein
MSVVTHDFLAYSFNFGGFVVEGFTEDEGVTIEFPDAFDYVVGVDGIVAFGKTNNPTAIVTFKLMSHSAANLKMSAYLAADVLTPGGIGVTNTLISNIGAGGTSVFQGGRSRIMKYPDISIAAMPTPVEWRVVVADLRPVVGGL